MASPSGGAERRTRKSVSFPIEEEAAPGEADESAKPARLSVGEEPCPEPGSPPVQRASQADGGSSPDAGNNGMRLSGKSALPDELKGQDRAGHLEKTLHPLISAMASEAVIAMPMQPAIFCLHWLLKHLSVPDAVKRPLLDWLEPPARDSKEELLPKLTSVQTPPEPPPPERRPRQASIRSSDDHPRRSALKHTSPSRESLKGGGDAQSSSGTCTPPEEEQSPLPEPASPKAARTGKAGKQRPSILKSPRPVSASVLERRSSLEQDSGSHRSPERPQAEAEAEGGRRVSILRKPSDRPRKNSADGPPRQSVSRVSILGEASVRHAIAAAPPGPEGPPLERPPAAVTGRRRSTFKSIPTSRMGVEEIIQRLSVVPHIRDLSEEDRRALADLCTVKQFEPHAEVVKYGDRTSEVLVVVEGGCNVSVPQFVRTLGPGSHFGEGALLKGSVMAEASLTAPADKELTVLSLQVSDVQALGLQRKLMKKCKKGDSRFIAHPELSPSVGHTTSDGHGLSGSKAQEQGNRGRVASEAPEYSEMIHVEKSEEDLELIKMSVRRNQYLTDLLQLSDAQVEEIAQCMTLVEVEPQSLVIEKGDDGDKFYVVQDGILEVLLDPDPANPLRNRDGKTPFKLRSGDSFGELALLYDSPRKASIASVRKSSLWVLELSGWRNVLKKMPATRIDEYLRLLSAVPELCDRVPNASTRRRLADSLEELYYRAREDVVVEGTMGMSLYFVLDGDCVVTCNEKEVARLSKGAYFGQEMLTCNSIHQNTVTVTSEHATILVLDRHTVEAMSKRRSSGKTETAGSTEGGDSGPLAEAAQGAAALSRRRRSLMHLSSGGNITTTACRLKTNKELYPLQEMQRVGVLGTGSFALVTLEHHEASDRLFALKAMPKKILVEKGLKNMVLGEREALAEIDSPFVVSLVSTHQDEKSIYFLLEPALGGELFNLYNMYDSWFGQEVYARFFIVCVSLGLQHMHAQRVIHRDIKLENILLDAQGYARITDLGLAKVVLGKTYTVCGSADYLAPETLKQVGHNRAVDWWAVGILAFCMMSGRMPFDADDVMQIYKNIVKGFKKETFPQTFSADLVDFIRGLCKKKPQERTTMLPGGVANLAKHPWLAGGSDGDGRWQAISDRTAAAPYVPPAQTVEEMRSKLKQSCGDIVFDDYEDDGTNWSKPF